MKKEFGKRLKDALKKAGYTQVKIAEELDLSRNAIGNYVKGRIPDATILYELSRLLEVTMEWLLTGEETVKHTSDNTSDFLEEITADEIRILQSLRKLNEIEKAKIEGMIEIKVLESKDVKRGLSSRYQSGEEAATREKKHA